MPITPDWSLIGQTQLIGVKFIVECPYNPRKLEDIQKDREELVGLRKGIVDFGGIHTPLRGYRGEGDRVHLVAGHRRLILAHDLNYVNVPFQLFDASKFTPAKLRAAVLLDNDTHSPIKPIDRAKFIHDMMKDLNLSLEEAAGELNMKLPKAQQLINLLDLPNEIIKLIANGTINESEGNSLVARRKQLQDDGGKSATDIDNELVSIASLNISI